MSMNDNEPRSDVAGFLAYLSAANSPPVASLSPQAAREQYKALTQLADEPAGDLAVMHDLTIELEGRSLKGRLFDARTERAPGPLIVFFHGGGFVIGDIDTHASACAQIARVLDLPVLSVDYRLAPEHPFPAAPDDAEASARWAAQSPEPLGRKVKGLVLMGDSAGGNLAIVTAMALRDRPAAAPVVGLVPLYPCTDQGRARPSHQLFAEGHLLTGETIDWFYEQYAAEGGDARWAPLNGDLAGLPPMLLVTCGLDPLRDEGRAFAARVMEAGNPTVVFVELAGMIHGFLNMRRVIPSSAMDLDDVLRAVQLLIVQSPILASRMSL